MPSAADREDVPVIAVARDRFWTEVACTCAWRTIAVRQDLQVSEALTAAVPAW
jgi:hypothetical protein